MSNPVRTLVCRPVYGFTLYAIWSDATHSAIVRYEIALPSGGVLPFSRDSLAPALITFHACTNAWFWFAGDYRLYPIFKDEQSDEAVGYAISGLNGQVFESRGSSDALQAALVEFERLTGTNITADDTIAGKFIQTA